MLDVLVMFAQVFSAHYIAARLGDLSYTFNTTTGFYIGIRFKTHAGERTAFMLDASVVMFAQVFSAHYIAVLLGDLSCTINTTTGFYIGIRLKTPTGERMYLCPTRL